jgi:hypothetical protein
MLIIGLTAEDCSVGDLDGLINRPGKITVTNTGTEPAVVALLAPDAKSYPTIPGGGSSGITTNVGGRYELRVVMSGEALIEYRARLTQLRREVEQQIGGTPSTAQKIKLFTDLAAIKAALIQLSEGSGGSAAGCTGSIKLKTESDESVQASVQWVPASSGGGFWDITCGSN